MDSICTIKFNLNSEITQNEIVQCLTQAKVGCIQISNGLCVRASVTDVQKVLGEKAQGVAVGEVTGEEGALPDIAAFVGRAPA